MRKHRLPTRDLQVALCFCGQSLPEFVEQVDRGQNVVALLLMATKVSKLKPQAPEIAARTGVQPTRGFKKKARTRQLLIESALRIYARKGMVDLALNELAEEAGVSSGTIYNYFRSREDVLEAVGLSLAIELSQQVSNLTLDVTRGAQRLSIGVRTFVKQAVRDPQWARAVIQVIHYANGFKTALTENVRADLQLGVEQGDFQYADENVALAFVVSATAGAMTTIVDGYTADGHDGLVAEMVLRGLGMPGQKARCIARAPYPRGLPVQK